MPPSFPNPIRGPVSDRRLIARCCRIRCCRIQRREWTSQNLGGLGSRGLGFRGLGFIGFRKKGWVQGGIRPWESTIIASFTRSFCKHVGTWVSKQCFQEGIVWWCGIEGFHISEKWQGVKILVPLKPQTSPLQNR